MRRRRSITMEAAAVFIILILSAVHTCDGSTRNARRRKDTPYVPAPSVETLKELAEAMGAAGFEHYTEGKALVKRLIPENSEPDLDEISHQGVIGKAGVDFPAYPSIPSTGFNCKNVPTGYYADLETDCQVFHICDTSRKISFLCPNGTIFSQSHLICDWWFKVDCASSPALYESSAEYYSNEQKKTHKITQSLSKNGDLQQISDASNIKEKTQPIRKVTFTNPTTTERLSRHRQRLQSPEVTPLTNIKATARSYHALFGDSNFNRPTQRAPVTTHSIDKRRKNLVQLIANNFGNTPTQVRTTIPTYTDSSTYRTSQVGDYNSVREMQVAAESASFTNNNNRQYLQEYNNKNYRPFPVYKPDVNTRVAKAKTTQPNLTTLFVHDIRENLQSSTPVTRSFFDFTTKRPTLIPYTKSYGNSLNEKHQPYTRPGVHLLKDFLDKEKNKTAPQITENPIYLTTRSDLYDTKHAFESVTKIPTSRSDNNYFTQSASSDRHDIYSSSNVYNQISTEPTYHERRERLLKKLNLDTIQPTEPTVPTTNTERQFGKRPGLIVPPSLTPKTLHTLAIYYATALDNLSTTTSPDDDVESTTTYIDQFEELEDGIPALFSRHTINKYSSLFGQGGDHSELLEELKLEPNSTNEISDDLSVQQSQNPLSTSPQIRELAQVFTHALSAYLQDPVQFRKVLSDIRPTHPSFGDMLTTTTDDNLVNTEATTTINEEDEEILGFSDDNKVRPILSQLRDAKSLNLVTVAPRIAETEIVTTPIPFTTEAPSTTSFSSSTRSPFRCCGRISASYTTAKESSTTARTYTNTLAVKVNTLTPNDTYNLLTTTENSYSVPKYGGFQNNSQNLSPYGKEVKPTNSKPLNDYVEATNLPTAWGVDNANSNPTGISITNSHDIVFESNRIVHSSTTVAPVTATANYIGDSESVELENEEELQRAHSQSFVTPQTNNLQRQGKNINFDNEKKTTIKRPSEELEAPTLPDDYDSTTVVQQTTTSVPTTVNYDDIQTTTSPNIIFTSPDNDKTTNQFQWSNNFENWQSTVILDPITLNDGLSATGPQQGVSQLAGQTTAWSPTQTTYYNTATTISDYTSPVLTGRIGQRGNEQAFSSSQFIEQTTPAINIFDTEKQRGGRLLKYSSSTEPAQELTTDNVIEKAKEIMGGMNATTTEKLMNVMKKTKSKTVRRLILLLVQTCDDDHNSTAEASKRALLEALMAVSQKDMDDIAKGENSEEVTTTTEDYEANKFSNTHRRMDRVENRTRPRNSQRSGKSLNIDPNAVNALTNPSTTESVRTTAGRVEPTTVNTTPGPFSKSTSSRKRGERRFVVKTTPGESRATVAAITTTEGPKAEARIAPTSKADHKTPSDTRALELLKSLYTIAARWG